MKTKIATTIEQSKKLVDLGLSADTADMNYCNSSYKGKDYIGEWKLSLQSPQEAKSILDMSVTSWNTYWEIIPAWSLSRLLELMPLPLLTQHKNNKWYMVTYPNGKRISLDEYNNPIDAVFEMMVYLLENKLIK
jgi:hypothetical protein